MGEHGTLETATSERLSLRFNPPASHPLSLAESRAVTAGESRPGAVALSVIVACADAGPFIEETLRSIRSSRFDSYDVSVVSLDPTLNAGEATLLQAPGPGVAAQWNEGLRRSIGQYGLCMTTEDAVSPTMLAECCAALDADPTASFAYTDSTLSGADEEILRSEPYDQQKLLERNYLPHVAVVRRSAWEAVGGFSTRLDKVGGTGADALWLFALMAGAQGRPGLYIPRFHARRRTSDTIGNIPEVAAPEAAGAECGTWLGNDLLFSSVPGGDYLNQVNGVQGFLCEGDVRLLIDRALKLPTDAVVVEIGSFMGLSSCLLGYGLLATGNGGARVHCIDTWEGSDEHQHMPAIRHGKLYDLFLQNIRRAGVESVILPQRTTSVEAAKTYDGGPIDLLFVDGDHSFEGCYADLEAWVPKVRPGGTILVHDCEPNSTVLKALHAYCADHGLKFRVMYPPEASYMAEIVLS